jgi:hypothetical protein
MERFVLDCTLAETIDGLPRWALRHEIRRQTLRDLGRREQMLGALEANKEICSEVDPVQRMITEFLRNRPPLLESLSLEDLYGVRQLIAWFLGERLRKSGEIAGARGRVGLILDHLRHATVLPTGDDLGGARGLKLDRIVVSALAVGEELVRQPEGLRHGQPVRPAAQSRTVGGAALRQRNQVITRALGRGRTCYLVDGAAT